MIRKICILSAVLAIGALISGSPTTSFAQQISPKNPLKIESPDEQLATDAALFASESARLASPSAEELEKLTALKKEDITKPEEIEDKSGIFEVFAKRPANRPTITNFFAFTVQSAVRAGVPANTIILILLLPLLATGITIGASLLVTIVLASVIAQMLLKKIRIMHMPKLALSILMVSIFVFATMVVGVSYGQLTVRNLSIFPVLLLILLSERIVAIQLERKWFETILIAGTSIGLGIGGYYILSWKMLQNFIILYPEAIFLLIPFNIVIGRYFGLRITEIFRFKDIPER